MHIVGARAGPHSEELFPSRFSVAVCGPEALLGGSCDVAPYISYKQ